MQSTQSELSGNEKPQESSATIVNLESTGVAAQVARRVLESIDSYCQNAYDDGHRKHLGASMIGDDCKRKLWYMFRHVYRFPHSGRMLRLFNRGHHEEDRFVEWLEGAGFKVWTENRSGFWYHGESDSYGICQSLHELPDPLAEWVTEDNPHYREHVARAKIQGIKFPQFRISGSGGHFGGSLDGIAEFPPGWGISEPVLLEFKTNGTGKAFNDLVSKKMPVQKPLHFAQTSTYGSDPNYQFRYVLYMNICKNDDDIHIELTKLDWNLGNQMRRKADDVILSQRPPPRLSLDRTYYKCKGCDFYGVCHDHQAAEKNCRSCVHARPVDGGNWICENPNTPGGIIPEDIMKTGCSVAGGYEDITLDFND